MRKSSVFGLLAVLALAGCGAGGGGDDGVVGTGLTVRGAAQKGPFVVGSNVTVSVLASDGTPTSATIETQTTDDLGSFAFSLAEPNVVQITVQGYHFNEISGKLSNSMLALRAIYATSDENTQSAHVNILTHLIHNRVLAHVQVGIAVNEAIHKAQTEFIEAFKPVLKVDRLPDFTDLSVYNLNEETAMGDAYLLALSAIVYQYATSKSKLQDSSVDAELTFLLNKFANNFAEKGAVEDAALLNQLVAASRLVRPDVIEANLVVRSYQTLGRALNVADINRFIDTDGDGEVNIYDTDDDADTILDIEDPEPYGVNRAEIQIENPTVNSTLSGVVTFSGTANEFTELVKVKVGNGPYVLAQGTAIWSLTFDTTVYADGKTEITIQAVQSDWGYTEKKIEVYISNIDPLVGTWSCSNTSGYSATQWFAASGAMNDALFSCWISGWERQGNDIIINRTNCSELRFTPIFSNNNNSLLINEATYWTGGASCIRTG